MESGPKAGQEVKVGAVLLMTTHKTVGEKLLNVSSYTKRTPIPDKQPTISMTETMTCAQCGIIHAGE